MNLHISRLPANLLRSVYKLSKQHVDRTSIILLLFSVLYSVHTKNCFMYSVCVGRRQGGGAKGAIAPPFFRGKEQNLQLTGVELAPWSFQLDFV